MKFIDFFAGVGGFRRGMELAGHECVGFCEFDKFATASYTSMHLLTQEQREFLDKMPLKQRQKEILKDRYTRSADQEICRGHSARPRRSEGEHGSRYIPSRNIRTGRRRADAAEHEHLERSRKTEESREGPAEDD